MHRLVAALVALAIGSLLYLNLDSGLVAPEPAGRVISLALGGLAAIFGVRAWTETRGRHPGWAALFAGLAVGVGGYAVVRLALVP